MRHLRRTALCASFALLVTPFGAADVDHDPAPAETREVIAVYLGTEGTDDGMPTVVAAMRNALATQASAGGYRFVARGVSLESSVDAGLRHLARLGRFDEVSVGGNWGNSTVVRYLGGETRDSLRRAIPQVVLLERTARVDDATIEFGSEREIARYIGVDMINGWVRRGAPVGR